MAGKHNLLVGGSSPSGPTYKYIAHVKRLHKCFACVFYLQDLRVRFRIHGFKNLNPHTRRTDFTHLTDFMTEVIEKVSALFEAYFNQPPTAIESIPPSGSSRRYFRLFKGETSVIAAYHTHQQENKAFISFTKHFQSKGLAVPQLLAQSEDGEVYLTQDLGSTALFDEVVQNKSNFPLESYQKTILELIKLQIDGHQGLDYSVCYPRSRFDKQSMLWDLNYFKYYFLRLANIHFDEQLLEDDFNILADYLGAADSNFFMHRDGQARNVMMKNGEPYFIDYQGGRCGPLQYDLVSLLYQAKAAIPQEIRDQLLDFYLDALEKRLTDIDRDKFKRHFYGFVLIRALQTLGAYGYRGYYERKDHFLESIAFQVDNLAWFIQNIRLSVAIPHLQNCLQSITNHPNLRQKVEIKPENKNLVVTVSSFSYKSETGIPQDDSGNGGGFVFDCRALHNPGRYEEYKKLTGRDEPVIQFLAAEKEVETFLNHVFALVDSSVERYLARGFTSLSVHFGCTGGQHRSVYCADQVAKRLEKKYGVSIRLNHHQQEKKNWIN